MLNLFFSSHADIRNNRDYFPKLQLWDGEPNVFLEQLYWNQWLNTRNNFTFTCSAFVGTEKDLCGLMHHSAIKWH